MKVEEFLSNHKLSPESFNIEDLCKYEMSEMEKGLKGESSSLAMIDSFCSPNVEIRPNEPIAVIDAGGTNFRTCLITFDDNQVPTISGFKKRTMPGSTSEVSAKEFFSIIADETQRLMDRANRIGFCFSYAAKILPDHDGIPLMFSKEIKAPEVIGKHLGKELFAEFERRGIDTSNKKIVILNDTVSTLLAGLSETKKQNCEGCVGFILGTGTNTALIHNNTIINTESGCLTVSGGDIDQEFLNSTKEPNKYHFEKMISGAYLGPTALIVLKHAKEEHVFSETFVVPESLETYQLSSIKADDSNDNENLQIIIENFVKRAAKLTASNLAASILFTNYGIQKPVLINADGTTFYKLKGLKENTEKYLEEYLTTKGRKAVFTHIEDSPAIGSAIGALA